ncbi:MAG: hypothetical protein JWM16_6081 [Verrucomicrobiales bacterium]|nr:hypothetical protein [Verrucomicrobiales bacterium]
MKHYIILSLVIGLSAGPLFGQDANEVETLRRQLKEANEGFEKAVQQHRLAIDALSKRLEALQSQASVTNSPAAPEPSPSTPPPGSLEAALAADKAAVAPPAPALAKPWSPADPIRVGSAQNYISLSLDGLFSAGGSTAKDIELLQPFDHDPRQNGFTVQNLELTLDGKVDPYFRAQANVVMKIDPRGETTLEAEEAYLETMALPWNLQVRGGQFLTEFGRVNQTHPHTWDFVDAPLVLSRMFGPEGLRNPGARVSWLAPTPFYSELFLTVQNSQGGTAFSFRNDNGGERLFGRTPLDRGVRDAGDMLYVGRYAAAFDLSDAQTILLGTSAALGPNSTGADTRSEVYGVDAFWKWKPGNQHGGFPFVTWQNEAMLRRYHAGATLEDLGGVPVAVPRETLTDWGFYSQVAYGFHKGWIAALRGDYVAPTGRGLYEDILGVDPERAARWRVSPNLTWYPSEFSKLRLQYNFDHRSGIGPDHSVWLQFEFLLGSHAAHKF